MNKSDRPREEERRSPREGQGRRLCDGESGRERDAPADARRIAQDPPAKTYHKLILEPGSKEGEVPIGTAVGTLIGWHIERWRSEILRKAEQEGSAPSAEQAKMMRDRVLVAATVNNQVRQQSSISNVT